MSTTHLLEAGGRDAADLLTALAARVTALYEHPVYRRLAGDLHTPALALGGASQAVAATAVAAVRGALTHFEELALAPAELPARARQLRRETASAQTCLARFAEAWERLPAQLAEGERQLAALRGAAAFGGGRPADAAPLDALAQRLDSLRAALPTDPLGVAAALSDEIEPALRSLRAAGAAAERVRTATAARLAGLPARLTELRALFATTAGRVGEREARILDLAAPPLPSPVALRTLADWRERLDRVAAAQRWDLAARSLSAWDARAAEFATACQAAARAADDALAERRRLRGWLRALQAQAGARRLSEWEQFSAAALEAQRLLLTPPTALPRVQTLLARCQQRLHRHVH
ncbi:MAG: hypothetical protein JSR82_01130 [Verrucomicrobia bacterium]|nr:hypothetical protein [Verrucomicrobiota bacterium]